MIEGQTNFKKHTLPDIYCKRKKDTLSINRAIDSNREREYKVIKSSIIEQLPNMKR